MKRILIPTDFSDCAKKASKVAMQIAAKNGAELHFVHLMDVPIDWLKLVNKDQKQLYPDVTKKVHDANSKLNVLIASAEKKGLNAKKFIAYNSGYPYLKKHMEESKCDMVVMGSHGASGLAEWLMGSNTQKVVRFSSVPVVVVKGTSSLDDISSVIFVSDFDKDTFKAYEKMLEIFRILGLKLQLLFINTPGAFTETEAIEHRMNQFSDLAQDIVEGSHVYNSYEFEEGLTKFASKHGQMIAMVTHGHKGSLTERIINHVDMPVLSMGI